MNGSLEGPDVLGQRQGMAGKVLVDHMSRVQGNDLGAPRTPHRVCPWLV